MPIGKASIAPGFYFRLSRKIEAARAATTLSPVEARIVAILITRQYAGPNPQSRSDTKRKALGDFLPDVHRNNVTRALRRLLDAKIICADDENLRDCHFFLNTEIDDWEGLNLATYDALYREFCFLEGKANQAEERNAKGAKRESMDEEVQPQGCMDAPLEVQERNAKGADSGVSENGMQPQRCMDAPLEVQACTAKGALSAGLERRDEEIPPKPPHGTFSDAHYDDVLESRNPKGAASGLGGNDGNARWCIRAGIGYLALEKGVGLSEARAVATALGRWIDEHGGALDPSRFADAIEIVGAQWQSARDPVGLTIAAYRGKAFRTNDPGALFRRWCELRGQNPASLYLPSLTASEADANGLEMAKREQIIARELAERQALKDRLAAERARRDDADAQRRQQEAQRQAQREREIRTRFAAECQRLASVSDQDLRDFVRLFHAPQADAMARWLEDGRPDPSIDGMAAALNVLRGFDAAELAEKRAEIEQAHALRAEIEELSADWRECQHDALKVRTASLTADRRMAVEMLSLRKWRLPENIPTKGLQLTRDGLRALAQERGAVA